MSGEATHHRARVQVWQQLSVLLCLSVLVPVPQAAKHAHTTTFPNAPDTVCTKHGSVPDLPPLADPCTHDLTQHPHSVTADRQLVQGTNKRIKPVPLPRTCTAACSRAAAAAAPRGRHACSGTRRSAHTHGPGSCERALGTKAGSSCGRLRRVVWW